MNTQITRPDFSSLNGQALVDAYNQYVDKWRNSKFSSKAEGVEACNKAFEKFAKSKGLEIVEQDIPDEFEQAQEDYDRAKQVETSIIGQLEFDEETSSELGVNIYSLDDVGRNNFRLVRELSCDLDQLRKILKILGLIEKKTSSTGPRKSKNSDKIISIKVLRNPRREGSKAWHHFEVMNRSDVKTVADYLDQFPSDQRKNANQWLSNTIADGFVELIDAK